MATGWGHASKENLNYARLCRLLIDGGTRVLREVFDRVHPPSTLHSVLHSATNHARLQGLRGRVLNVHQWQRLYPRTTPVTSAGFDITLLFVLLRNICNLTRPATGWDKLPFPSDLSKEADLARIKFYRNELYAHRTDTTVSDADFELLWTDVSDTLIRLGGAHTKRDIDRLKVEPMNFDDVKYFIKALEDTEKSINTAIENQRQQVMEKLEDIEGKLGSNEETIKDSEQRVMGKLEDIAGKLDDVKDAIKDAVKDAIKDTKGAGEKSQRDVENPAIQPTEKDYLSSRAQEYTRRLKSSIERQTESLPVLEGQTAVSIDDVFTNVTIQRVEKDQEKTKLDKRQFDVFQASSTTLKKCSEMFSRPVNDDPNSRTPTTTNPKCILLTGKAGIGKSEFCRKMSRDWSRDGILDFKFIFLLTYRQLSLLGHEELDLCDIINRSPLLDEQSMIDEGLLQYMIENPEEMLIICDGYDEYGYRTEITGDFETKYPNNPRQKMPVPAMIAKIMKGKILRESVVMISSRPEEAQELKKFPFDVKCEIHGFSPLQVQEYVQKYFKDDESMKKAVLDHIQENEILLSFGHIPVMCYLMCSFIKLHMIQSQTSKNLPNTRSELYYEVIKAFITRHSASKYSEMTEAEVEEILHKLAELAIYLKRERKIVFTEEDMKSFKFSKQELTNLKKSGLFDCCPGLRKCLSEKPPLEFSFSHLTIQEFLCAYGFVERKKIPEKEGTSEVIWTFMAGLLRRKNDEKLMDQLIEKIKPQDKDDRNKVLTLHCLYEYNDEELSTRVINTLHDKYCNSYGRISFVDVNNLDCLTIGYLLDIIKLLNVKQTPQHLTFTRSSIVNTLYIRFSSLSSSGVSVLCKSLSNCTFVTGLELWDCRLDDECVKIIAQTLNNTTITDLSLQHNPNITAKGITDICAVLSDCSVEKLNLSICGLDDEGVKIIAHTLNKTTITRLDLVGNNITDEGVKCLCDVVSKRDCHVKELDLWDNDKITAECKTSARKLLQLNKPDVLLGI